MASPTKETYSAPLQLDVKSILRRRAPRLPGCVAELLGRLVRQKQLNYLLREAFPYAGYAFSKRILELLDIRLEVCGEEHIPAGRRLLFASNHPLGGLDGIALIALLGERYGDEGIAFPVNDMLMNVRPLEGVFTPINKYGCQGRDRATTLSDTFASDRNVIIFPAGLVSRLGKEGIRDLEWRKTFITRSATTGRTIVPIRFEARNRRRFYRTAYWRKKLGIPVNIEQIMLPGELVNCRHKTFRITFMPAVDPSLLTAEKGSARSAAAAVREMIYDNKKMGT